jgi:hypothetical protein
MSTFDDDDIEFEFFDEPQTVEAAQRPRSRLARGPRAGGRGGGDGPRRPPMRTPTGLVPLARLVGLIGFAIVVIVVLVLWISSCQGKSKHDEYASYTAKVRTIAQSSSSLGTQFANKLIATGPKLSDLQTALQQYAQQEQQAWTQAQEIRPPGPLRAIHQRLADALELRYKGLVGLADVLSKPNALKNAEATSNDLTAQAQLLSASDVVWDQLYRLPATQQMQDEGVRGVVVPESHFVGNADLLSSRAFGVVLQKLGGASTGGTPSGLHGSALVSVRAQPQGADLSTSTPTTVRVSADLSFAVTVEDSGNFNEVNVGVKLTVSAGGTPIVKQARIALMQPSQQQTVKFGNFNLPTSAFGNQAKIKVQVLAVPGEKKLDNNSATYPVIFSLG